MVRETFRIGRTGRADAGGGGRWIDPILVGVAGACGFGEAP